MSLVSIRQPGPSEGGEGNASITASFLVKISLLRRFALRMRTIDKHARSLIFSRSLMACLKPGDRFLRSFMTIFLVKGKFMTLPYAFCASSLPSALGMRVPPQRTRRRQVARRRPLQREIKAGGRNCWKKRKKKEKIEEALASVAPLSHSSCVLPVFISAFVFCCTLLEYWLTPQQKYRLYVSLKVCIVTDWFLLSPCLCLSMSVSVCLCFCFRKTKTE